MFNKNRNQVSNSVFSIPSSGYEEKRAQGIRKLKNIPAKSYLAFAFSILFVGISFMPAVSGLTVFAENTHTISGTVFEKTDSGDLEGLEDWTVKLIGYNEVREAVTGSNGGYSFAGLTEGDYKVCQVRKMGWQKIDFDSTAPDLGNCHNVTIHSKNKTDANFFNESTDADSFSNARLTVITHVVNDSGGQNEASDFTTQIVGNPGTNKAIDGASVPGTEITVEPGEYHIDSTSNNNYTKFLFGCSERELGEGEHGMCVIIQNDIDTVCPLENKENRTIIGFPESWHFSHLNARHPENNSRGPLDLFNRPENGLYDVTMVSFDNHDEKSGQHQPEEQWFFKAFDKNGNSVFTSDSIDDLPENQNRLTQQVHTDVEITSEVHSVSVHHKLPVDSGNNINSISPLCIAFDKTDSTEEEPEEEPEEDAHLTLHKTVVNDDEGEATADDFQLFIDGDSADSGEAVELEPGTYTASENSVEGYAASGWTGDCSTNGTVTLSEGENAHCSITNNDIPSDSPPAVTGSPNLTLNKNVVPTSTSAGEEIEFTITIENEGNSEAENAILEDTLPEGFTFQETGSDSREWTLGDIAAGGGTRVINADVRIAEDVNAGNYTNNASVDADNHAAIEDTAEVSVTSSSEGEVLGEEASPVLEIVKSANKDFVNPGGTITFTVAVTNSGEAPAENLVAGDTLPDGFRDANGNKVITFEKDRLDPGETFQESFVVSVSADAEAGEQTNEASAEADNHDTVKTTEDITVRKGAVLGKTGVSPIALTLWVAASLSLVFGVFQVRRTLASVA